MKIAYFIDHLRPDGTQFVLEQLVRGMHSKGHKQTIYCLNDSWDDLLIQKLQYYVSKVDIIGKAALFTGIGLFSILSELRSGQYDVVITLLFAADVICRPFARFCGIPRIINSIQNRNENYKPWQHWLLRITSRFSDRVVLCSSNLQDYAVKKIGVKPQQIRVINHSINVQDYALPANPGYLRREYNLSDHQIILGSVGRLTYQKAYDVLLQAIKQVDQEDFVLIIAGEGEEQQPLQTLAKELHLTKQVIFSGYRRDIPLFLSGLDLYVHPSRFEGMSLAILQAMASARPIIATEVDGTQELLINGENGWLVPPNNVTRLKKAIEDALTDPVEAQRRGAAAQKHARINFDEAQMVQKWEQLLS